MRKKIFWQINNAKFTVLFASINYLHHISVWNWRLKGMSRTDLLLGWCKKLSGMATYSCISFNCDSVTITQFDVLHFVLLYGCCLLRGQTHFYMCSPSHTTLYWWSNTHGESKTEVHVVYPTYFMKGIINVSFATQCTILVIVSWDIDVYIFSMYMKYHTTLLTSFDFILD